VGVNAPARRNSPRPFADEPLPRSAAAGGDGDYDSAVDVDVAAGLVLAADDVPASLGGEQRVLSGSPTL
jgi:hypothetical protein